MKKKSIFVIVIITALITISVLSIGYTVLQSRNNDLPTLENLIFYEESGPFDVSENKDFEENSIYYPTDLGRDGMKHPIVVWGDGTGALPSSYSDLLRHLASHGFVVIGPNDENTGEGETMIAAMELMISKNDDPLSPFYQTLDVEKICVTGHSQGAASTLLLRERDDVTCIVPLMLPYNVYVNHGGSMSSQNAPILLIAGTEDLICPPATRSDVAYSLSPVPTFYGKLIGANHFEAGGDAGEIRKYLTAWCYVQLFENATAREVFYGSNAIIHQDLEWIWASKNILNTIIFLKQIPT
ncbi:MAG: hypothetical protein JW891_13045 [Candidatus Lokiarchaeota archaeon]|nr:hypothetical protein [Candidatus Lokiarchaeota archaeon]